MVSLVLSVVYGVDTMWILPRACFVLLRCRVDSRLVTIDERFCVTVQAISPVQEIGISHVGWAVFVIEPDRQQAIVFQCLSAERERKEEVLWSVLQSRCQRKVHGTVQVWVWGVSENSILMDEISENIFNEELDKLSLVKIQFRENFSRLTTTWRIWNEEIQNTHKMSHSVSLNLKDYNCWKSIRASWTWENTFV